MKVFLHLILSLSTVLACFAQADFQFRVTEPTKTGKLDYTQTRDLVIYDFESEDPRLNYSSGHAVYGIRQDSFAYTNESWSGNISRVRYAEFLKLVRTLPLEPLDIEDPQRASSGWIVLDGEIHAVYPGPGSEDWKKWQAVIDNFLAEQAPVDKREKTTITLPGDAAAPLEIDFATLWKDPAAYDKKRIRISGYYHGGEECSSFAATRDEIENYAKALWLGGPSKFAEGQVRYPNDTAITVEGTYLSGSGGHMGLWNGWIERATYRKKVRPPAGDSKSFAVIRSDSYQDDTVIRQRLPRAEDKAAYLLRIEGVCGEFFADTQVPESLEIIFAVKPGKKSRFWILSSNRPDDSEELVNLRTRLESIPPFELADGPLAFFIQAVIAGDVYEGAIPGNAEGLPIPWQWSPALDDATSDEFNLDQILKKVWPSGP